jgi:hypothetical protein
MHSLQVQTRRKEHTTQLEDLAGTITTIRDADSVVLTQELREFTRAAKEKQVQLQKELQVSSASVAASYQSGAQAFVPVFAR